MSVFNKRGYSTLRPIGKRKAGKNKINVLLCYARYCNQFQCLTQRHRSFHTLHSLCIAFTISNRPQNPPFRRVSFSLLIYHFLIMLISSIFYFFSFRVDTPTASIKNFQ